MKKTLVIIFSIILCIAIAGAAVALGGEGGIIKKDTPISESETKKDNPSQKSEESTESIVIEETETLSAEDKALKAEIAKISDTKVDFRVNKIQKLENENYNLTYKEIDPIFTEKGEEKLVYTGKTNDGYDVSFKYNVTDGKLFLAEFDLPETEKSSYSLSISEAEKIARKYAAKYCDLSSYELFSSKEIGGKYMFAYSKKISGYETDDEIILQINFNGELIFLRDNTGIFEDVNFIVDETKLVSKLERILNQQFSGFTEYEITKKRIGVSDGNAIMKFNVIVIGSNRFGASFEIPIE